MELEQYLKQRHAPSTVKRYLKEIQDFKAYTAAAEKSSYAEIMEYLNYKRKQKIEIRVSLFAIKKYYSYLIATKKRKDHPASSIRLRDGKSRAVQLQDLFTSTELENLLNRKERYSILKHRNKLIIGLMIYQALTNGELVRLKLKDFNLEAGSIFITESRRTLSRTLKLKPQQVYHLMEYIYKDRPKLLKCESDKLLISKIGKAETGEGISYLIETLKPLYPERKLNAKTIRQSVITNLLKQGKDLRLVQVFAGHKYPSSTERYRQTNVEMLKAEVLKHHPLDANKTGH